MPQVVRYNKPFLSQVILRVDLASPFKEVVTSLPNPIQNQIVQVFPVMEAVDKVRPGADEPEWVQRSQWSFYNRSRSKRFACTPFEFFVEYYRYESFETVLSDFNPILNRFCEVDRNLSARRVGLRYVNKIDLGITDRSQFTEYIRNDLLLGFHIIPEKREFLARSLQNATWNTDDVVLNFNFGIPNVDFPAPITKNEFVLDIDVHSQLSVNLAEVPSMLEGFHSEAQKVFESAILEPLRARMEAVYE